MLPALVGSDQIASLLTYNYLPSFWHFPFRPNRPPAPNLPDRPSTAIGTQCNIFVRDILIHKLTALPACWASGLRGIWGDRVHEFFRTPDQSMLEHITCIYALIGISSLQVTKNVELT